MYMLTWPDHRKYQTGSSASWLVDLDSLWSLRLNGRLDLINYRLLSEDAKEEVAILGYPDGDRNDMLKNFSVQVSRKITSALKTFDSQPPVSFQNLKEFQQITNV